MQRNRDIRLKTIKRVRHSNFMGKHFECEREHCPECGAEVDTYDIDGMGDKFCWKCGQALEGENE